MADHFVAIWTEESRYPKIIVTVPPRPFVIIGIVNFTATSTLAHLLHLEKIKINKVVVRELGGPNYSKFWRNISMCIYLYIKTHNKTGLKYLGKTKQNPFNYLGSGIRWRNHLRVHGNDVTTEILRECVDNQEVKIHGIYYSNLFNVVNDPTWANLKIEAGDGGAFPLSGQHMKSQLNRIRMSTNNHMKSDVHRERMKNNNPMNLKEFRDKISAKLLGKSKSEDHKKNIVNPMLNPEISSKRAGQNNPLYNHTKYQFNHTQHGNVTMTQDELVKTFNLRRSGVSNLIHGRSKSTRGWTLLHFKD